MNRLADINQKVQQAKEVYYNLEKERIKLVIESIYDELAKKGYFPEQQVPKDELEKLQGGQTIYSPQKLFYLPDIEHQISLNQDKLFLQSLEGHIFLELFQVRKDGSKGSLKHLVSLNYTQNH